MNIDGNATGDFGSIIDGLTSLVLRRRGNASELAIPKALKRRVIRQEAEQSDAMVVATDAVWEFELPADESYPCVGDMLIESEVANTPGDCWTILKSEPSHLTKKLRCTTRNLTITNRLDQQVAIDAAKWEDLGSGPEITGWQRLRRGVAARIQPLDVEVDQQATPLASISRFRIFLAEPLGLDHNHRLVDVQGTIYTITRYTQANQFDKVPVAEATVERAGG